MKQLAGCKVASIGEAINHELGVKMVRDYRKTYPDHATSHQIGIDILRKILAQPGCEGIRFYNALNELGKETLVYAGVDSNEQVISEYVVIGDDGEMTTVAGIIGDRLKPGTHLDEGDSFDWGMPE